MEACRHRESEVDLQLGFGSLCLHRESEVDLELGLGSLGFSFLFSLLPSKKQAQQLGGAGGPEDDQRPYLRDLAGTAMVIFFSFGSEGPSVPSVSYA